MEEGCPSPNLTPPKNFHRAPDPRIGGAVKVFFRVRVILSLNRFVSVIGRCFFEGERGRFLSKIAL